VDKKSWRTE